VGVGLHGGYDQVIEISESFLVSEIRRRVVLADASVAIDTPDLKASGTLPVAVRNVWLASPAERFESPTGPMAGAASWKAQSARPRADRLVLAIEIDSNRPAGTGLRIERLRVQVGGNPTPINVPAANQYVDVHVGVEVGLDVKGGPCTVRTTSSAPFPNGTIPAVYLATPVAGNLNGATVSVVIDQKRLRASPFVTWATPLAQYAGLDPEQAVVGQLLARIQSEVEAQVTATLVALTDALVKEPGRQLIFPVGDPMATAAAVLVDPASLRVLVTLGGSPGDRSLITQAVLGAGDDLGICVSNASLLRDTIQPLLTSMFSGLKPSDFRTDEPCTVDKNVAVTFGPPGSATPATLWFLQAGIDEMQDLIIWFFLDINALGSPFRAEIEVPVTLTVKRVLAASVQSLSVEADIHQAKYGLRYLTWLPTWFGILQAVLDGKISGALKSLPDPAPFRQPLPAGTEFSVTSYDLMQADAPTGIHTWPTERIITDNPFEGVIGPLPGKHPARWRDHDLCIRLAGKELPKTLSVRCAVPDSDDPGGRLDALGGTYPQGGKYVRWGMGIDDAIAFVRSGGVLLVGDDTPNPTVVEVVEGNPPFLRTKPDATTANNLSSLPPCPAVVDSPAPAVSTAPITTLFSPTMVHWRDVIPVGDKGDETVNAGATVSPGCVVIDVVLEIITRDGTVLASTRTVGSGITASGGGANIVSRTLGGRSLAVDVHWWFDAYSVCRYRIKYLVQGNACP
jgi:hypothetical protein